MKFLRSQLLLVAFALACPDSALHAKPAPVPEYESWERIQTPTRSDLWGIYTNFDAYEVSMGHGSIWTYYSSSPKYVAVGTQGTIITSQHGDIWVTRSSGTNEWLLGVTYGKIADSQIWVVVGDNGIILTSADGTTWTPQISGTSQRLNGVGFNGTSFLAVGENGTLCFSQDGIHWSVTSTGTPDWLRGVAYSEDQKSYIVSGANGRIFLTSDGKSFTQLHSGGAQDIAAHALPGCFFAGDKAVWHLDGSGSLAKVLEDSTFFRGISNIFPRQYDRDNNRYSAVGTSGSLGLSPHAGLKDWFLIHLPTADNLLASHSNIACGQGGVVWRQLGSEDAPPLMDVSSGSSVPGILYEGGSLLIDPGVSTSQSGLSYHWYKDGKLLEGATQPALQLNALSNFDRGTYSCAITNADHLYLWHIQLPRILPAPPSTVQIEPQTTVSRPYTDPLSQLIAPSENQSVFPEIDNPSNLKLELVNKALVVSRLSPGGEIDKEFQPVSIPLAIPDKAILASPLFWSYVDSDGRVWVAIRDIGQQTYSLDGSHEIAYNYNTGFTIIVRLLPSLLNDTSFSQITLGNNSSIYLRGAYIYAHDRSIFPAMFPPMIVRTIESFQRYSTGGILDTT
ncbi:MAG: hypothetical protein WC378_09405 [Opitutaceae bacterium]